MGQAGMKVGQNTNRFKDWQQRQQERNAQRAVNRVKRLDAQGRRVSDGDRQRALEAQRKLNEIKQNRYLAEAGALVIQAHPFREAAYIDHIRLFPRQVYGVETYNACRTPFENDMAALYAKHYGLPAFSGTDNHVAGKQQRLGGMKSETPVTDEQDFIKRYINGELLLIKN